MKREELSPDKIADTIASLALAGRISEYSANILIELANRISKLEGKYKIDINAGDRVKYIDGSLYTVIDTAVLIDGTGYCKCRNDEGKTIIDEEWRFIKI